MAPAELSPTAAPVTQYLKPARSNEAATPAQAAWLRFVDRVERGEITDPVGQYVAKITRVDGQRVARPKVDVALRDASRGYALRTGQKAGAATNVIEDPCEVQYTDPCAPCYAGPDGCGGGIYSKFTSSEGLSGIGDIQDLKVTIGVSSPGPGYYLLDADLNKGAGGYYLYYWFTRNPGSVLQGEEQLLNKPHANDPVADYIVLKGGFLGTPNTPNDYFSIWYADDPSPYRWNKQDLNDGANGEYLYSYQSKSITTSYFIPDRYCREVGILSGNSPTIVPPPGWHKYYQDLNEGAGGDFIYFCYR